MQKLPKLAYPAEFQEQAMQRVKDGQRVGAVAQELGLVEQTLRHGVTAYDVGARNGAGASTVTPAAVARSRLRAEHARRKRAVDIL
jgi:transposase